MSYFICFSCLQRRETKLDISPGLRGAEHLAHPTAFVRELTNQYVEVIFLRRPTSADKAAEAKSPHRLLDLFTQRHGQKGVTFGEDRPATRIRVNEYRS